STDVWTTSGRRPASASMRPPETASLIPFSDNGTSTHPVNRFRAFHSLSPWRSRISVCSGMSANLTSAPGIAVGLEQVPEGLEVAGRLAPPRAPVPLAADGGQEAQRQQVVERGVGGGQDAAEQGVHGLGVDALHRQPAD